MTKRQTQLERFLGHVEITTDCWLWRGARNTKGYGLSSKEGKNRMAHRVSYQIYKGDLPQGMQIDHLCRVRSCVNPEHLEAVSCKENNYRSYRAHNPNWQPPDIRLKLTTDYGIGKKRLHPKPYAKCRTDGCTKPPASVFKTERIYHHPYCWTHLIPKNRVMTLSDHL